MQPDIKAVATDHKDLIHDVSYNYYGDRLATCSSDQTVKIWEKAENGDWQKTADIKGHNGSVWRISWAHPEFGSVLATCSFDRTAAIWEELVSVAGDSHTNKVWLRRYLCVDGRSSVTDAKFSPKHLGLVLATSSCDGIVRIYEAPDVMNLACWTVMLEINVKMSCSSLSWCSSTATQPLIAVGCDDTKQENNGKVVLFTLADNLSNFTRIGSVDSVKEPVQDVAFAPNLGRSYNLLAIASKGITLIKLKPIRVDGDAPPQFEQTQIATFHEKTVWRLSWNVTGTAVASTTDDGVVRVWKANYLGEWRCNLVLKDGAIFGERWGIPPSSSHLTTHSEDQTPKPQAQTKRNSGWPYFNAQKDQGKHY